MQSSQRIVWLKIFRGNRTLRFRLLASKACVLTSTVTGSNRVQQTFAALFVHLLWVTNYVKYSSTASSGEPSCLTSGMPCIVFGFEYMAESKKKQRFQKHQFPLPPVFTRKQTAISQHLNLKYIETDFSHWGVILGQMLLMTSICI